MAIARTAKGTANNKDATKRRLRINDVTLTGNRSVLLVGVAYDESAGAPSFRWGPHPLQLLHSVSGNGVTTTIAGYYRAPPSNTRDIVVHWVDGEQPTAKAMFAIEIADCRALDQSGGQSQAATDAPGSGAELTGIFKNEIYVAAFGSEGPSSDDAGIPLPFGFQDGQRAGTVGTPPASNITIHETYRIFTTIDTSRARLTGATERDWSTVLVTMRPPKRMFIHEVTTGTGTTHTVYNEAEDEAASVTVVEAFTAADVNSEAMVRPNLVKTITGITIDSTTEQTDYVEGGDASGGAKL